ncbi:MAG: cupin-like domain-containing protein [Bacteroidetes bacterium]|nr:cupin-like domain-containing protein [Bacteroidota bacterium]
MQLQPVTVVDSISPEDFKNNFYRTQSPVVIKTLSKNWPARNKWNWDYFKQAIGEKEVGVYNNVKSDAYTPINKAGYQVIISHY